MNAPEMTGANVSTIVRDGRQELDHRGEHADLGAEIATFASTVARWERYETQIGGTKERQLLLEIELGTWLDQHCPVGRPRLRNGRATRPFLRDLGISKYRSTQFRKMARLGPDKVSYAIRTLRCEADGPEITRAAVLAFYTDEVRHEADQDLASVEPTGDIIPSTATGTVRVTLVVTVESSDPELVRQAGAQLQQSLERHRFTKLGRGVRASVEAVEIDDEPGCS